MIKKFLTVILAATICTTEYVEQPVDKYTVYEKPIAGLTSILNNNDTDELNKIRMEITSDIVEVDMKKLKPIKVKFTSQKPQVYYTKTSVNFRRKWRIKKNNIISTLYSYKKVKVIGKGVGKYKKWFKVKVDGKTGYINKSYLIKGDRIKKVKYGTTKYSAFKAWMPHTAITDKSSLQYKLQENQAYTGQYGIRQVDGRFCAALGGYYSIPIGDAFDIVMKNGEIIPCISADIKANKDTDSSNMYTVHDHSTIEFVVSFKYLSKRAKNSGNIGDCKSEWGGNIKEIIRYKKK